MNVFDRKNFLSQSDCNVLKGIAIIGIFLHNYFHCLPGIVGENEFAFDISKPFDLLNSIKSFSTDLPLHIISFFGHYGVPIFLFLSAYGLEMKYNNSAVGENPNNVKDIWRFSKYHFLKLFRLMFVGYVTFLAVNYSVRGTIHLSAESIVLQLSMLINIHKYYFHEIIPGPYWYFGLMLQLYVFYRLFLYKRHWGFIVCYIIVFTLLQLMFITDQRHLPFYRYNFMGNVLPLGLGILYSRYGYLITPDGSNRRSKWSVGLVLLCSLMLIFILSFNFKSWIFIPAFVCIFSVYAIFVLKKLSFIYDIMLWFGSLSSYLFISHPIARRIFINVSKYENVYTGLICYILVSISLAWIFREIMKKIPNPRY